MQTGLSAQERGWTARVSRGSAARFRSVAKPALALGLLLIVMLACRWDAIWSSEPFNPDEAEVLAAGRRAVEELTPYREYTTGTYLYLWPWLFGVLGRIGVPLSLTTAHVLAGLAYVWLVFAGWVVLARTYGWVFSGFLIAPTAVVLFAAGGDLHSLGTELLPISIIMVSAVVLMLPRRTVSRARILLVAAIAGMSVWAKPQLVLVACSVVLIACVLRANEQVGQGSRGRAKSIAGDLSVGALGFLIPSVISILWMWIAGTLGKFWSEPISVSFLYVTQRSELGGVEPGLADRLSMASGFVLGHPMSYLWAVAGLIAALRIGRLKDRKGLLSLGLVWATPLVACYATLLLALPIFGHYANVLYCATMLAGMGGASLVARSVEQAAISRESRSNLLAIFTYATATLLAVAAVLPVVLSSLTGGSRIEQSSDDLGPPYVGSGLEEICPAGSRVLVWGWAAELYSIFDWAPASRYVITTWQQRPQDSAPYRSTLETELLAKPPTCIVEAIGPEFFRGDVFNEGSTMLSAMPSISGFMRRCYELGLIPLRNGSQLSVYRRTSTCPNALPTTG